MDTSDAEQMFSQVRDTAFERPVVPDVNMTSARDPRSNTCAACSAKWITLSTASWRAISSRRRSDARPDDARPSPRVERGSAASALSRAVKLMRRGRAPAERKPAREPRESR